MFLILTIKDNILHELISLEINRNQAEKRFLETCKKDIHNWDTYTKPDIEEILDQGFVTVGCWSVMYVDLSNLKSDDEIAGMVEYKNICEKLNRE